MAEPPRRKTNNAVLAVIVISLLVVMGLVAFFGSDGQRRAADSGVTMPVDAANETTVMPESDPGAPVPERR